VVEHPDEVFGQVGLLFDGSLGLAALPFIQSSNDLHVICIDLNPESKWTELLRAG